jgi:dolichyl-phosphate-mannose-protein mannosyltransferase
VAIDTRRGSGDGEEWPTVAMEPVPRARDEGTAEYAVPVAGADATPVPNRVERFRRRPWYLRPFVVIAFATALAGVLRFYHLSSPAEYVFDEVYYAKDGCFDAGYPFRQCQLENPGEQTFTVHPPLGRWIIAGGERLFGNRPLGWRVASATFGTASVLLLAILAYQLFGGGWGGLGGLLLATESLNFVQSRMSMLDILLTAFVVLGFLALVLDRGWIERRTPPPEPVAEEEALLGLPPDRPPSPVIRPWRLVAGVAFGAATATKWSGATAVFGGILLVLMWERTRRRERGMSHPIREAVRDELFGVFLFLVLVPILVYLASYARWFVDNGLDWRAWWNVQRGMADYSIHLRATHPYASRPWTWLLMSRPVAYYYKGNTTANTSAEILGMGNPAIFWGALVALPWCLLSWWRRRDWRAGFVVVAFAAQYLPWLAASRTSFLFYMTPVTPFMVLAVEYGLKDMWDLRVGESRVRALAPLAVLLVLVSVGLFAYFLPILTGRVISYDAWHNRMWFDSWI